jgi:hypothetical protein
MKTRLLKLLLLVLLAFFALSASGQHHNYGLYVKVSDDGEWATYERVWSKYVPDLNNEPILPGDIQYVPPTLPGCNPDTGICDQLQGSESMSILGDGGDRIRVPCGPLCNQSSNFVLRLSFMMQGGGGGGSDFEGENYLRELLESQFEGMCNAIGFETDIPLTAEQSQALFTFLNGPNAQALWNASNYVELTFERREQVGFQQPDGTFQFADIHENGPCTVTINDQPGSWPEGTIMVHTHPWSRGQYQDVCEGGGGFYQNVPSVADHGTLMYYLQDVNAIGLILDADGFILFTPSGEGEFHETVCGFERTQ